MLTTKRRGIVTVLTATTDPTTKLFQVIADNYDSIGNDVIRNFRHYISSKRHFWLKGDQTTNPSHVSGDASCAEPTKCHPHSGTIPKATSDDNVSSTDPT